MISVVIPTLDAARRLGPTLAALMPGVLAGLVREVVLADGGSTDDTAAIAEATGAHLVAETRGRGSQLAAGAAAATGSWLLFLHADTVLSPDWPQAAEAHMRDHADRAGWFHLRFDSAARAARRVERWANWRAHALGLPYGDQGLLIARTPYRAVGGHPAIPLMEDVALARRLGRARLRGLDATATTSAARYEAEGWTRRGARNLSCLALYALGVSPERIAVRYNRSRP